MVFGIFDKIVGGCFILMLFPIFKISLQKNKPVVIVYLSHIIPLSYLRYFMNYCTLLRANFCSVFVKEKQGCDYCSTRDSLVLFSKSISVMVYPKIVNCVKSVLVSKNTLTSFRFL